MAAVHTDIVTDTPNYTIDATETSLDLLETLVESAAPMGVTALADRLDVSKSVVHNHLSTLRARGYVVKRDSRYEPSLRPLDIGSRTRAALPVYQAARRHLDNLAAAADETTVLFVLEAQSGVPVYIAEASEGWSPQFHEGERLPLHVNAPGKAILASLSEDRVDDVLDETDLVAPTSATITEPGELKTALRGVRDDAVAFCRGEQYEGIVGVATPVTNDDADTVAALGVCGPVDRLSGRYLEEDITGQVLSTAKSIQVDLTGQ
ncbi:IclR family transcriptional regulator [Halomicroarcula sp. S1AR25-4]|uniref:IclR family transcriptional regulator n=1 Tax=Haloarcula sp. S1AR25-4 TaxID=2950538 RepID=UPI002874D5AC|nr:IclR family transcriptional regulator [Halomicroarcula sp. S1AR25-4]MDS0277700.1 IclR family transcriptional regulator [Halomicroarcula sp. S1AR25-4]